MNRQQRLAAYEREKELLFTNKELKDRVAELEAQLGIALAIMFDSQVADFQEQCENNVHIVVSDTTKQPE